MSENMIFSTWTEDNKNTHDIHELIRAVEKKRIARKVLRECIDVDWELESVLFVGNVSMCNVVRSQTLE